MKYDLDFPLSFDSNLYYKNDPEKFILLKELIEQHFKCGQYSHMLKRKRYIDIYEWVISQTSILHKFGCNIQTMCYWIMHDLHDFPRCLNCGKKMTIDVMNIKDGYQLYCCNKCQVTSKQFKEQRILTWRKNFNDDTITAPSQAKSVQLKQQQTCMKNYGVAYPMQSKRIFEKGRQAKEEKYGDKNFVNPQKAKQTKLEKYGDENYRDIGKMHQTSQERYGVDNFAQSPMYKQIRREHSIEKYGVDDPNQADIVKQHQIEGIQKRYGRQYTNAYQVPEIRQKIEAQRSEMNAKTIATKRKNKTFNTSKPEEECYKLLLSVYPGLLRQHRSEKYPFACDFYDPSSDTYFEFNGSWTHGGHFFDESSTEDQEKVQKWRDKGTKFYLNAIQTWTVRDVKKRKTAMENNLNYVVFWNLDEVREHVLKRVSSFGLQHFEVNKTSCN